jgi:hypothetical protein
MCRSEDKTMNQETTKERPILFSGPMVRAILAGQKTQTRRLVKPVRGFEHHNICKPDMAADPWAVWWHGDVTDRVGCLQECKFGKTGDRLWVREAWTGTWGRETMHVVYAADGSEREIELSLVPQEYGLPQSTIKPGSFAPSIHMPRFASRITLEITGVRVERLQEISAADAVAEGCQSCTPYDQFRALWSTIHSADGPNGWAANPYVWVVEFKWLTPQ